MQLHMGFQKRCEVLLTEWVSNGIKETGIGNIVMSGGVAQNIKANKLIAELDGVNQVFIPPGPGDESISIGAAFLELVKNGMQVSDINSPSDGYFGPSHSEDSVKQAIDKHAKPDWNVRKVKPSDVAELIANGDVVSRFGLESMEFGARALGNRSIIADPRRPDVIHHINKLVKMRDFGCLLLQVF